MSVVKNFAFSSVDNLSQKKAYLRHKITKIRFLNFIHSRQVESSNSQQVACLPSPQRVKGVEPSSPPWKGGIISRYTTPAQAMTGLEQYNKNTPLM